MFSPFVKMEKTPMAVFSIERDNCRMKKILDSLIPKASRPEHVGPRITAMRETLGLSKSQLADSIGLDRSSMTKIEKGEAGLDIVKAIIIAELYDFGLDYISRGSLSDSPPALRPQLLVNLATHRAMP